LENFESFRAITGEQDSEFIAEEARKGFAGLFLIIDEKNEILR
jgi:hypothetical protein